MKIADIKKISVFVLALFCILLGDSHATDTLGVNEHYFYRDLGYGSDALIHPVRLILHGGFGILQMANRDNDLLEVDFKNGANNLWMNLKNPVKAVQEEGVSHFFVTQVIPISTDRKDAYYWPNYTLHLLGGGMSYRMMIEWYQHHNFKYPKIWAGVTITVYHVLNEIVENSEYVGYNTDAIADMYIFNPIGIILFSNDKVSRFFSEKLNLSDWSYQIALNPYNMNIRNNGQNFMMRYWFGKNKKTAFFYHFGTHGEIGLSFKRTDGNIFSLGAGLEANSLINQSDRSDFRELTTDLVLTAGLFYDRENSLLASLIYSKKQDYKLRMNVYPGIIKIGSFSPGVFWSLSQQNKLSLGFTITWIPLGLSS
ncbi:hypothetical protein JXI42_12365 [bacterium]|nr:hypothetical protein [bacterium]